MASPWPFAIRGFDIVSVLPIAKEGAKYDIIVVDHFTKWIEAELSATITAKKVSNYAMKNIICRFKVSQKIIKDNRTHFESAKFRTFASVIRSRRVFLGSAPTS